MDVVEREEEEDEDDDDGAGEKLRSDEGVVDILEEAEAEGLGSEDGRCRTACVCVQSRANED